MLDVKQVGWHRARLAHLFAHAAHLLAQRGVVARGGQNSAACGLKVGCHAGHAGRKAGPCQRLVFPGPSGVATAPHLVTVKGRHRGDQQTRAAVGPQRGVDVKQLTGRCAQRQPGDDLADKGAVDLLRALLVVVAGCGVAVAVVVQEHHVQVAAVAQFLAAQFAVGDDRQARLVTVALLQARPGPAQGDGQHAVGQGAEVVGHLFDGELALDVAHQGAKDLGMVGVAQGVEQAFFIVFTAALPGRHPFVQFTGEGRGVKALAQQAQVGQFVDDARVAHQVLHGPACHAQEAQQAAVDFGAFHQKRQVVLAAQQGLQPVHKAQGRRFRGLAFGDGLPRALHQTAQTGTAVFAQRLHPCLLCPVAQALGQRGGQLLQQRFAVHLLRRARAAPAAFAFTGLAFAEQRVKLRGHQFTHLAQALQQRTGLRLAGQAQAFGDPAQVVVVAGQQVGLLVVQVLDAVLHLAQERIARGQLGGGVGLHQAGLHQSLQATQGAAGADFGKLAASHHQHQLHDELNLANATARQLHIVGALGPAGGAALCFVTDLAVQLAQPFKDAVVQVAAVNKGRDQRTQGQRPAAGDCAARRHHAALEPGKALPLAALDLEVLFQHGQAGHRRARVAVGAQRQIDTKHKPVVGGLADQCVQALGHPRKVLVHAGGAGAVGAACGLAVFFVDVDQVDVGRHIELACTELAHAHDPEVHALALGVEWRAVAGVGFCLSLRQRQLQRDLGQMGHASGDLVQRGAGLHVQHGQAFQHQLARHAQRAGQVAGWCCAGALQPGHQVRDLVGPRQSGRQLFQVGAVAAADALHKAAVCRVGAGHGPGGIPARIALCTGLRLALVDPHRQTPRTLWMGHFLSAGAPG